MLLEWARASWAHVYATSTSLEWFLWSWVVLVALYWLLGAAYLVLDVTHWPAFLYRHKLQPARPFIIGGSQHNPPLKSLIINSLIIHFAIFLPGSFDTPNITACTNHINPHKRETERERDRETERYRERDQKQQLANDTQLHEPTNEPNSLSCDGYHVLEIVMEAEMTNGNGDAGAYGLHLLFERGWMYATAELPRWTEVLGHMGVFVVVEEIGFFYSHLLFHQGRYVAELDGSLSFYRSIAGS